MTPAMSSRQLYKELWHLGKEYPLGAAWFNERLRKAFLNNAHITDPDKLRALIDRGQFVIKELEALYALRKYRTLRARYHPEEVINIKFKEKLATETIENEGMKP